MDATVIMPATSKCKDRCYDCGRLCLDFLCGRCEVRSAREYHNPFDFSHAARPTQLLRERREHVRRLAAKARKGLPL